MLGDSYRDVWLGVETNGAPLALRQLEIIITHLRHHDEDGGDRLRCKSFILLLLLLLIPILITSDLSRLSE